MPGVFPAASFFMVAGRADTQPLFPDDPSSRQSPRHPHPDA